MKTDPATWEVARQILWISLFLVMGILIVIESRPDIRKIIEQGIWILVFLGLGVLLAWVVSWGT